MSRNKPSWKFFSEYLGVKLSLYADGEDEAWDLFRVLIQPKVQEYFILAAVEGSPTVLKVRK